MVFFLLLIYYSSCSFLLNVGHKITLKILIISPSGAVLPLEQQRWSTCNVVYHTTRHLPETLARKTFDWRNSQIQDYSTTHVFFLRLSHQFVRFLQGETLGRFDTNVPQSFHIRDQDTTSNPNLEAMSLLVFFFRYCSSISFLLNVDTNSLGILTWSSMAYKI